VALAAVNFEEFLQAGMAIIPPAMRSSNAIFFILMCFFGIRAEPEGAKLFLLLRWFVSYLSYLSAKISSFEPSY
jgi:hypothetical protein